MANCCETFDFLSGLLVASFKSRFFHLTSIRPNKLVRPVELEVLLALADSEPAWQVTLTLVKDVLGTLTLSGRYNLGSLSLNSVGSHSSAPARFSRSQA